MNLNNLTVLKSRFGNDRNFNDLIDTLAAINKPPLSVLQTQISFLPGTGVQVVPHTLGAVPVTKRVGIQLQAGLSDLSWSAGTIIDQDQIWQLVGGVYMPAVSSSADASNVYIVQAVVPTSFYIFNNSATPALSLISSNKWAYVVYANLDYVAVQSTDPVVIIQPASVAVASPTGTTFTVAANGTAPVTYQWQVSTDSGGSWAVASGGVYSGGNTVTLTLSNSAGLNGYQYRCVITNGLTVSIISNVVTLTVS